VLSDSQANAEFPQSNMNWTVFMISCSLWKMAFACRCFDAQLISSVVGRADLGQTPPVNPEQTWGVRWKALALKWKSGSQCHASKQVFMRDVAMEQYSQALRQLQIRRKKGAVPRANEM